MPRRIGRRCGSRFPCCWAWAFPVFRLWAATLAVLCGCRRRNYTRAGCKSGFFIPSCGCTRQIGTPDKEPWSFGWRFEAINKRAIELRYELLPYIYNVMQQASETGVPALRPLFLEFPDDEHAAAMDDEFLFGSGPAGGAGLWEGADARDVYLPAGDWFDYWTGKRYAGNSTISHAGDAGFDSAVCARRRFHLPANRWCKTPAKCPAIRCAC